MIIAARFNGPPNSGNGGYTAGCIATYLAGAARAGIEVTLRRPPPLETELIVQTQADKTGTDVVRVYHGPRLVAEAAPSEVGDGEAVAAIGFADARSVSASYRGFAAHPLPWTAPVAGPCR